MPTLPVDVIAERLQAVIRGALAEPGADLGRWEVMPLSGGVGAQNPARSLLLLRGDARVRGADRRWSVILKGFAPEPDRDDPAGIWYWRREPLLYRSGALDDLPPGLAAPRCYRIDEQEDGTTWLWLEHVREDVAGAWPDSRWALAARHLGRFNGGYLAGRPLPRARWLEGGRLRSWLQGHNSHVARIAAAPDNPQIRLWWPRPVVDGILRLWQEREVLLAALERLPRTFGHGDAIRRNLLARHRPDGAVETVAIDWEFAGLMAAGEEVGQTLSVASAFYDVEPDALQEFDEAVFAGYLDGLVDAGWRGDRRPVRFAHAAHCALRNAFNAVGATVADEAGRSAALRTYGHTWEELAARRAALRPFLLARADEARRLLPSV